MTIFTPWHQQDLSFGTHFGQDALMEHVAAPVQKQVQFSHCCCAAGTVSECVIYRVG